MARKLGENQKVWLRALLERASGEWYPGCGIIWTDRSSSIRLCESLERRGVLERIGSKDHWRLVDREQAEALIKLS